MVLGPPTTISDSGVDYSLSLQGALNRDPSFRLITFDNLAELCMLRLTIWAVQMEQSMVLGPPTTISDSGVDYSLYLQGALNRDTTRFLWGFPLGQRDYFSVWPCKSKHNPVQEFRGSPDSGSPVGLALGPAKLLLGAAFQCKSCMAVLWAAPSGQCN